MSVLTENVVLSRTRSQDLRSVKRLNCWGSELRDVSIVRRLPNVEVLSLSINHITSLSDFAACGHLQELYLRQNKIQDINELLYLIDLQELKKLWLAENPCSEFDNYRSTVLKALPNLEYLDNIRVSPEEVVRAEREGFDLQWPGSDCEDNDEINQQILPQESQIAPVVPAHAPQQQQAYQTSQSIASQPQQITPEVAAIAGANGSNGSSSYAIHNQNSSPNSSPIEMAPQVQQRSQTMIKSNSLSDYNLYNVFEGKDRTCRLCGEKLSLNITRNKHHFQRKCPNFTKDMIQSIDTDYWEVRSQASTDSQDIKGTVAITGSTSSAAIEQVFPNAEPNANNYCNYSGYQNLNTPRIQSAPNGSSAQRLLPKGGKHRNANILSAVLCLIKELDYASLEVVDTTIHCRMEEMED